MKTYPSILVGFESGLLVIKILFPSICGVRLVSVVRRMQWAFCNRSVLAGVSVLFSCMPVPLCLSPFSFDTFVEQYCLWGTATDLEQSPGSTCCNAGVEGAIVGPFFPCLPRDHLAVCDQAWQGTLAWVVGPSTPCQEGKESCSHQRDFHTCLWHRAAGLARQRHCALFCVGCRESGLQTENVY